MTIPDFQRAPTATELDIARECLRRIWGIFDSGGHSHGRSFESRCLEIAMALIPDRNGFRKMANDDIEDFLRVAGDAKSAVMQERSDKHHAWLMNDTAPQPGPISDSASGVGSSDASGGVDLSGIQQGTRAETRSEGVAVLEKSYAANKNSHWCYHWRLLNGWEFSTDRSGRAVGSSLIDDPLDITRLLPENGGGT